MTGRRAFDAASRREFGVAFLLAILCLISPVRASHGLLRGVTQPYDLDQFRDTASAQSIIDGRYPADPDYLGETLWYNPLTSAVIAGLSRVSGLNVSTAQVRFGPIVNACVMLAFFTMAAALTSPWVGLTALIILVYAPSSGDPAWATPGYSPWLFTQTLAAGLFYASIAVFAAAFRRDGRRWWALAGAALGITFLGHTGPALVLGLAVLPGLLFRNLYTGGANGCGPASCGVGLRVALVIGFALVASSPFLWSIVGHYHLRVLHHDSMTWGWPALADPWAVARGSVNVRNGIAVIGAGVLAWRARQDLGARLVWAWYASAAVQLLYGFAAAGVGRGVLPTVVPLYHFFFYLRAAGVLFAAVGICAVVEPCVRAVGRRMRLSPGRGQQLAMVLVAVAVLLVLRAAGDVVRGRADLENQRAVAARFTMEMAQSDLRARLRAQTPPSAIVFASAEEGLRLVAPSGRSVLVVPAPFSNPYVAQAPKEAAFVAMNAALSAGDDAGFARVAREHGVTHVLLSIADALRVDARRPSTLEALSRQGPYALYRVR